MPLYLSHKTAQEYWRSYPRNAARPRGANVAEIRQSIGMTDLKNALDRLGADSVTAALGTPLHILVPNKESRCQSKQIVSHVWQGPVPARSFAVAFRGAYVAFPELCLLQMANYLSFLELVCYAFELCGSYFMSKTNSRGFDDRIPLTSVSKIKSYLESAGGLRGARQAKRAICFVLDGSASPMETILVILLCFPRSLGGYGLPSPILNYGIRALGSMEHLVEQDRYACDACWPDAKIAVEYDSDREHTGSSRIDRDSRRRNELISMGFEVRTVTRKMIFEYNAFDRFAHQLAKGLGYRLREKPRSYNARRLELRKQILGMISDPF